MTPGGPLVFFAPSLSQNQYLTARRFMPLVGIAGAMYTLANMERRVFLLLLHRLQTTIDLPAVALSSSTCP